MTAPNLEELANRVNKCISSENEIWDVNADHYGDMSAYEALGMDYPDEDDEFVPDWEGALKLLEEVPSGTYLPVVLPPSPAYDDGGTILHVAAGNHNVPLEVIQRLIEVLGPEGVRQRTGKAKSTPLHYAFDQPDIRIIGALAEADPTAIHHKDSVTGQTPLERLVRVSQCIPSSWGLNPMEAVAMLLEINPTPVVEYPFPANQYNYHQLAIQSGAPQSVKDALRAGLRPAVTAATNQEDSAP